MWPSEFLGHDIPKLLHGSRRTWGLGSFRQVSFVVSMVT
jgi:hypothetical protein